MTPTTDELIKDRAYFDNKENQVHERDLKVGDHFILDLYPIYGNGENRSPTDVEICEVVVSKRKHYHKRRSQWFNFEFIRVITTGKKFGYPNGYWKVPQEITKITQALGDKI